MKPLLNKLLSIVCVAATVLLMTMCGGPSSYDLRNADEMEQVGEFIKSHITDDMLLDRIEIRYSDSKSFKYVVNEATIIYIDPENSKRRAALNVDLQTGEARESDFYKKLSDNHIAYQGIKMPEDFNYRNIATAINAGLELAVEDDYEINGIGSFTISLSDTKLIKSHMYFKMLHIKGTTTTGRIKRTSYEEISIKADLEGNLID